MKGAVDERLFEAAVGSRAYALYARELLGLTCVQPGFCDMASLQKLLGHSGLSAGSRVLHMGCGDGRLLRAMCLQTGAAGCGVDPCGAAVDTAQNIDAAGACLQFFHAAWADEVLPGGLFDAVLLADILPGKTGGDLPGRLFHLLKPGGRLLALACGPLREGIYNPGPLDRFAKTLWHSPHIEDITEDYWRHLTAKRRLALAYKKALLAEENAPLYRQLYENSVPARTTLGDFRKEYYCRLYVLTK